MTAGDWGALIAAVIIAAFMNACFPRNRKRRDRESVEAQVQRAATAALVKEYSSALAAGDTHAQQRYREALERREPWALELADRRRLIEQEAGQANE